ncbi:MAG: GNAT family N-acetyltransferase [Desulfobacteraceae bacterium]
MCIGAFLDGQLCGWIGLRPMYEKTWELHPMAIIKEERKKGIGRNDI